MSPDADIRAAEQTSGIDIKHLIIPHPDNLLMNTRFSEALVTHCSVDCARMPLRYITSIDVNDSEIIKDRINEDSKKFDKGDHWGSNPRALWISDSKKYESKYN